MGLIVIQTNTVSSTEVQSTINVQANMNEYLSGIQTALNHFFDNLKDSEELFKDAQNTLRETLDHIEEEIGGAWPSKDPNAAYKKSAKREIARQNLAHSLKAVKNDG